jgi:hypothetical protein
VPGQAPRTVRDNAFDFPADRPVQISVNFCGSALAILGFADVGCQSGAAAFPDSFGAGS